MFSVAALASQGLAKLSGTLLPTLPGSEAEVLSQLADPAGLAAGSACSPGGRPPAAPR